MTSSSSPEATKFTVTGDGQLDTLIEQQLADLKRDLLDSLPSSEVDALVLGGGYGRGEGGALSHQGGFVPYNDYDLVLVHRVRDEALLWRTLVRLHEVHSEKCGVHVDITPVRRQKLPELPQALTWYELQKGHHVLLGEAGILREMGERQLSAIPASEWGRLLFNRGSGVLFALWMLQGKRPSIAEGESFEAFSTRQVQKAWLALGDVWLADRGAYVPSVVQRRAAWLDAGGAVPSWSENYLAATDFKLSPTAPLAKAELVQHLAALSRILGPELTRRAASESRPAVGLYSTAKKVRFSRWLLSRPWRYPRERLRLALAAELGGQAGVRRRLVGSPGDFLGLWEQYA